MLNVSALYAADGVGPGERIKIFLKKVKKSLAGSKKCVPLHPLPKGGEKRNKVH